MTRYFGAHTLEGEWHSLLPRYALLADRVDGKQILDIGCGTGIGSSLLLELGADGVNGIDHRPEVLELARVKHAKQGLNFQVMFWEELEYPEDSFDMVLCLDPTSPVTDPSLLLEIQRVLRPGGEYICAIERRNLKGLETLLPRYGYSTAGEEVDLSPGEERVPQLGELEEFFETIVSVVQRPRYSFVFDLPRDDEHTMRRNSDDPDESGLWVGDTPHPDEGAAEQTDNRAGRWLGVDDRLAADDDPASVELLFCGDDHMPPPTLREIQMPYQGLVDRLHQLFSELQIRQHPDQHNDGDSGNPFEEREPTSEFREPGSQNRSFDNRPTRRRPDLANASRSEGRSTGSASSERGGEGWHQVRQQLDRMTRMYREIRTEMEDLFVQTRQELAERDRYIEQLVDTVHRWKHELDNDHTAPVPEDGSVSDDSSPTDEETSPDFEREPTSIFRRKSVVPANGETERQQDDLSDEPETTKFRPDFDEDSSSNIDNTSAGEQEEANDESAAPADDDGDDSDSALDDAAPDDSEKSDEKTEETPSSTEESDTDVPSDDVPSDDESSDDDERDEEAATES